MDFLKQEGITTIIHYPIPPHLQNAYKSENWGPFPVSEELAKTSLSLPIDPFMVTEEQDYVIEKIHAFFSG
jgi:dTDP-4-amino-4,6-dideoxygalactose transaminase